MKKQLLQISIFILCIYAYNLSAEQPRDYTFFVGAKYDTASGTPKLTLSWAPDSSALEYTIRWKYKHNSVWSEPIDTLPPTSVKYTYPNIRAGVGYEFQIKKKLKTPNDAFAYIYTGYKVTSNDWSGKLLLFVDETIAGHLDYELRRYIDDLTGDGWEVILHSVPRTEQFNKNAVKNVKDLILRDCNYFGNDVKSIVLLGRIAVPYSGDIYVDDHDPDHRGAWAADMYYGDINGIWTDTLINLKIASRTENWNIPGDGKFDQTMIPSDVDIPIGRIDFYNLPSFSISEIELLRNYLNKNHDYRHKKITVPKKSLIDDGFGMYDNEAFAADAWLNFYSLFDSSDISEGSFRYDLRNKTYLWAYGCNSGSYNAIYNTAYITELDTFRYNAVFTMLFGSYNGDWDSPDNLLRAAIASNPSILTCSWSGRPFWFFHRMGLNETIGDATLISQNNQYLYESTGLYGYRYTHTALMGDPTLKMYIVAPPSYFFINRIIEQDDSRIIILKWENSPYSVLGYNLYRMHNKNGNYEKLNNSPIVENYFVDSNSSSGAIKYMLKAVKLDSSPTGTFYNMSQGIFAETMIKGNEIILPKDPVIKIYPNPASESLTIEIDSTNESKFNIQIFDALGKIIKETTIETKSYRAKTTWNLLDNIGNRLNTGLYIIKILTKRNIFIEKIFIIKN